MCLNRMQIDSMHTVTDALQPQMSSSDGLYTSFLTYLCLVLAVLIILLLIVLAVLKQKKQHSR